MMKKGTGRGLCVVLAAVMSIGVFSGTVPGSGIDKDEKWTQTAECYLWFQDQGIDLTVDVSGGRSVMFTYSSVCLFDSPVDEAAEPVAYGYLCTAGEYQDFIDEYSGYDTFAEDENGARVIDDGYGGSNRTMIRVNKDVYFLVVSDSDEDAEDLVSCFRVEADQDDSDGGWYFGTSNIYTEQDIEQAVVRIMEEFEKWKGCQLYAIRYAGDDCASEEKLAWVNQVDEENEYTQVIEFLMDFRSPVEEYGAWDANEVYTDYQWWLARTQEGSWELISWGY